MFDRKRPRDEDETDLGNAMNATLGFTEHRNKRLQSLPLRSSPTHKRWTGPPSFPATHVPLATITPTDSDSEDVQGRYMGQPPMDVDRDTDMMVDGNPPSQHLNAGPSQPDPIPPTITGRMPTPIHCTFAAQVRGNSWGAMNQAANAANLAATDTIPEEDGVGFAQSRPTFPLPDPSVPRSVEGTVEWSIVQNRRLPSPISENGGEEPPTTPGMVLDSCPPMASQLQRPYLPHMPHSTNPHAMGAFHPNIQQPLQSVDADASMMDTDGESPASAPATPSPRSKFGHSRSKHTLNSWTLQPGMKKSFSIGYRADCEKCRMKTPGHFNHIIVS
ncbi:hypothetical protein F4780DRAFT_563099 [Xylariomycetidae sp. FL0641]|nr:hypothetical protein F4780DRAFT_563099 [Xylariomycetidae sp. FL0641]